MRPGRIQRAAGRAVLPAFNTAGGQAPFFTYGSNSIAAGRRLNYTPQLYYYLGPFGLMGEYVVSTQKVAAAAAGSPLVRKISNHAWQAAGSWVLTGEKKSFRGVVPRRGIEARNRPGKGAWEVAGRYAVLNVDPTVFSAGFANPFTSAQSVRAWTVGLNRYLNYFLKLQLNYEQTHFVGGGNSNRPTEKVFEQRLQVAF
jgi:phosphate-selective porin OprO and OprP